MIVDFTIAIGHMTRSSYELMWIFNFVPLTPRLMIGDLFKDLPKLRVIDKVKASVEAVYERRRNLSTSNINDFFFLFLVCAELTITIKIDLKTVNNAFATTIVDFLNNVLKIK